MFVKNKMTAGEKIRQLQMDLGVTQEALAALIRVDQGHLSKVVSGKHHLGPLACLLVAGLDANNREYWTELASLSTRQLEILSQALPVSGKRSARNFVAGHSELVAAFLDFWQKPLGEMEKHVRGLLKTCLVQRMEKSEAGGAQAASR